MIPSDARRVAPLSLTTQNKVLPPLPEQKRIVAILDEAFEGIDRAIANTEKNLANAREIFESYLNEVFTQKGDDWVDKTLGEVYTFKNGINFNKDQKGDEGILTIDVLNMYSEDNNVKLDSLYRVNKQVKEDYILKQGDILFVRSSVKREGVGWTAYFPEYTEPVTFCGFIIRARPVDQATINPDFLVSYFRVSATRERLIGKARQATITNISQNLLSDFPISYPNWTKQTQITAKLNEIKEQTQRLEAIYQRKLEALQELKQSILHKAFTGELTNPSTKLRVNPTVKEAAA